MASNTCGAKVRLDVFTLCKDSPGQKLLETLKAIQRIARRISKCSAEGGLTAGRAQERVKNKEQRQTGSEPYL